MKKGGKYDYDEMCNWYIKYLNINITDDDDEYYDDYDDYYEENEEEKPKKPQKQKQTNDKKQNKNQNKSSGNKDNQKPKDIKKENVIKQENKDTQLPTQTSKDKEKEKTPSELNAMKYPKIDYKIKAESESQDGKTDINIVIIGHVDSGKSTLMGHLLYDLGKVDKKVVTVNKGNYKKTGANNFRYAWATDESTDERVRGVTVDIAYKSFETNTKKVNAMDAPGHRDFIPNMIAGTSLADSAILVIDSGKNAFDSGFFQHGQTKEHAILAKNLGVKQIIVCVNKLELFNWNKERFDYIENNVRPFLISLGFEDKDIFFVPISGLTGDNMINKFNENKKETLWYKGKSLLDTIDSLESPIRTIDSPVRFIVNDFVYGSVNGMQGYTIFGKLESGIMNEKTEYTVMPNKLKVKIKSININGEKSDIVMAGQTAEILLNMDKGTTEEINPGDVLCSSEYIVPVLKKFKCYIKTLELKAPISLGQKMFLHLQGQKSQVKVSKILKIYNDDSSTVKNNTIFIPKNFNAIVNLECENKICVELFGNIKALGRITLRWEGETLAVGYVQEFI